MRIVPLYAGVLTLFFMALSVRTIRLRGRLGIVIGPGEDASLQCAIRVHANFAEYVPLAARQPRMRHRPASRGRSAADAAAR